MKHILTVLLLGAVLFSCKKDRLNGDFEILVGEWKWIYSNEITLYNDPVLVTYDLITPNDVSDEYKCEFLKNGKVNFIKNGVTLDKFRTVFMSFVSDESCYDIVNPLYDFKIHLNNKSDNKLSGCLNNDTLRFVHDGFPFNASIDGTTETFHHSYFVKVK